MPALAGEQYSLASLLLTVAHKLLEPRNVFGEAMIKAA